MQARIYLVMGSAGGKSLDRIHEVNERTNKVVLLMCIGQFFKEFFDKGRSWEEMKRGQGLQLIW